MPVETAVAMTLLIGLTFLKAIAHIAGQRHAHMQLRIATRGTLCQGKVTAIQRPFLLEASTRLYFEFKPPGTEVALHCCHVYRRSDDDAVLPAVGTTVTVRYLPERPEQAVIGRLVRRAATAATA